MSTTELERRLTEALQRRAEEAMSSTNTEERLVELLQHTRTEDTRRRRWTVGGLVAAAAVIAVGGWLVVRDTGSDEIEPAGPPSPTQVATDYLRAAAAYDLAGAESYLSSQADLRAWGNVEGWRQMQLWNQAVNLEIEPDTCQAGPTPDPEVTRVECPYAFTGLGSAELGLAPYVGSSYVFTVKDGAILTVVDHFEYLSNNFASEVWEPFATWVADSYPKDVDVMYADDMSQQVTTDRSLELWRAHLYGYLAAMLGEQ